MRHFIFSILCLELFVLPFIQASPGPGTSSKLPRELSILINPSAQPNLPSYGDATSASSAERLNLSDIQGDILIGMKKKAESFIFFHIDNTAAFKIGLKKTTKYLTTTPQLLTGHVPAIVNVAFSQSGLTKLGVTDSLGDDVFSGGQFADAANLGDVVTNWLDVFKGTNIHGVFLIASDGLGIINKTWHDVSQAFGNSLTVKYTISGQARPGNNAGHEHFGFMDGIGQPAVKGFTRNPTPGQAFINPGSFLLGESGDTVTRPAWAKGGSFLAFRQLKQLVPEFHKFLLDNPILLPGFTAEQGSALMGARMVGRWPSGAPVDLTPLADNPTLATSEFNNNFNFSHTGEDITSNQTRCPFSAHIRKVTPRADLTPMDINHHILRSGIPYGTEVTPPETASNTTSVDRGLAFVAYQSNLANGFQFLQMRWANNPNFVPGKNDSTPGFDPLIGSNNGRPRQVSGLNTLDSNDDKRLPDFVQSRGGEYFFVPSVSAITHKLAV